MGKPNNPAACSRKCMPSEEPIDRIRHFHEFHVPLLPEERRKQASRCMNCGIPFCQSGMIIGKSVSGCPLNNLVPEWNDLLLQNHYQSAYERLTNTNSFPEFTSRVCPAFCEAACTCNLSSSPVTVQDNERSIIEWAFAHVIVPRPPTVRTGKSVAVIGSGPSGLAAADRLNRRGHSVTVYERSDRAGGLLMYGIPNMKLEKEVVVRRLNLMEAEGVQFILNADVGKDCQAQTILSSYDAVVLCCGASQPRDISVPGRDSKGILFAVDYLKETIRHLLNSRFSDSYSKLAKGKHVLVIGGGDTGNDCIATVIRQGCRSVTQLEMMPKLPDNRANDNPWPQWPQVCKTGYGQQEAIALFGSDPRIYETTVKEFLTDESGSVCGAVLISLQAETDTTTSRTHLVPIADSERTVPADLVLLAAGFMGPEPYVSEAFGMDLTTPSSDPLRSFQTSLEKVFVAGDMHRGASLVVWNILEGRLAAAQVDDYLMGYSNL